MSTSVREEWDDYLRSVIDPEASAAQVHETRMAFYSGGLSLLNMIMEEVSAKALGAELLAFADQTLADIREEKDPPPVDRLDNPARPKPQRLEIEAMGRAAFRRALEGLPRGVICTVFVFSSGKDGFLTYISNGDRQDMIKALVEWLGKIAGAGHGADVKAALDDLRREARG